jgi:hypothetical protein
MDPLRCAWNNLVEFLPNLSLQSITCAWNNLTTRIPQVDTLLLAFTLFVVFEFTKVLPRFLQLILQAVGILTTVAVFRIATLVAPCLK